MVNQAEGGQQFQCLNSLSTLTGDSFWRSMCPVWADGGWQLGEADGRKEGRKGKINRLRSKWPPQSNECPISNRLGESAAAELKVSIKPIYRVVKSERWKSENDQSAERNVVHLTLCHWKAARTKKGRRQMHTNTCLLKERYSPRTSFSLSFSRIGDIVLGVLR